MQYRGLMCYDTEGKFVGYAIQKTDLPKLQSVNLWSEGEEADLRETLARLNSEGNLRANWPAADDQEVRKLLDNQDWEPLELVPVRALSLEDSKLAFAKKPAVDDDGFPVLDANDEIIYTDEDDENQIDWANSELVYTDEMAPRAEEVQRRVFKAQEIVAARRAGVTT